MNTLQGIELGRALRDQGMESVEANSGEWKHVVRGLGETWLAWQSVNTTFTGEDIRMFVQSMGVSRPHHPNAWGAVIGGIVRRALKAKTIEVVGIRGSSDPISHARRVVVYRKSV
jgi:hypothetical protein